VRNRLTPGATDPTVEGALAVNVTIPDTSSGDRAPARGPAVADTISGDAPVAASSSGPIPSPLDGPPALIAGRYGVVGFIGGGGFGAVYKAVDQRLDKVVAVKLLSGHKSGSDAAIKRFQAEALSASRLAHPNIVAVTDYDVLPDGRPYLVMEFVSAPTLELLLTQTPRLAPDTAAKIAREVCSALEVAHREHVIHRDLKPANITVAYGDLSPVVKILDFGVAKLVHRPGLEGLTGAGQLIGTPAYMAPEQVQEKHGPLDGRADLYSLGVVLYEMLTGTTPFAGRAITDVLMAHLSEEPKPPRTHRSDLPPELEAICLRAMHKRPEKRFQNAAEMGRALNEFLSGRSASTAPAVPAPAPASRRWRALVYGTLGLLVAAVGVLTWQARRAPHERAARPPAASARPTPAAVPASAPAPVPAAIPASAPATAPAPAPPSTALGEKGDRRPAARPARPGHGRRGHDGTLPDAPATKFRIPK
jgi:hypothetical protein